MVTDLTLFNSDLVISYIFAFIAGMIGMMVYIRLRRIFNEHQNKTDEAIIEAIVLEYTRRLRDYDKAIAELRSSIDMLEMKTQTQKVLSQTSQPQHHVAPVADSVTITQHAIMEREFNGTTDYILKLLLERPRTSREVQYAIGRTREHTSRLMKKLNDSGLVNRDINTKPFRYNITDAGRETLKERTGAEPIVV
jgi:CRP-like cAMP-binding protein